MMLRWEHGLAPIFGPDAASGCPAGEGWYIPRLSAGSAHLVEALDAISQDADGWITGVVERTANRVDPHGSGSGEMPRVSWLLVDAVGANVGFPDVDTASVVELLLEFDSTQPASSTGARAWIGLAEGSGAPAFGDTHRFGGWAVDEFLLCNVMASTTSVAAARGHVYARADAWSRQWTVTRLDPTTLVQGGTGTEQRLTADGAYATGQPRVMVQFGCTFSGTGVTTGDIKVRPRVRVRGGQLPI